MNIVSRIIIQLLANGIALVASAYFIEGFSITPTPQAYIKVAVILTIVNIFLRPLLKLVLSPLIFITLGLGVLIINALLLYGIDYIVPELTITGLFALVYATLITSVLNYLASAISKKKSA